MAASRTGTPVTVNASANSGSTSVTVPADCTGIAVFFNAWISGAVTLTSMTLNGASITIDQNLPSSGDAACVGVGHIVNPATGSQTFAWDWSGTGAIGESGVFHLVFLKDVNTSDPISDHDALTSATAAATTHSLTLTTAATDFCLGAIFAYLNGPTGDPTSSDQTVFIDSYLFNNYSSDVFQENTTDSPSTVMNATGEYASLAAISWKAAGGNAFTQSAVLVRFP